MPRTWFWEDKLWTPRNEAGSVPLNLSPPPNSLQTPQRPRLGLTEPHYQPAALRGMQLLGHPSAHLSVCPSVSSRDGESWGSWSPVWPCPIGSGTLLATCRVLSEQSGKGKQPSRSPDRRESGHGQAWARARAVGSESGREGRPRALRCPPICCTVPRSTWASELQRPHPRPGGPALGVSASARDASTWGLVSCHVLCVCSVTESALPLDREGCLSPPTLQVRKPRRPEL